MEQEITPPTPDERPALLTWNKLMKFVRRIHLYSGLFMLPWVLLYGSTALLFNHPTVFPDTALQTFGPAASPSEPFGDLPTPAEIARDVVAKLQLQSDPGSPSPRYRLTSLPPAEFTRNPQAVVKNKDAEYTIVLSGSDGSGIIRVKPHQDKPASGPKLPRVELASAQALRVKLDAGLKRKLDELGIKHGEAAFKEVTSIRFGLEIDGVSHHVNYHPTTGDLSVAKPASSRRFLLRLHMAHHYPGDMNVRWLWALAVDLMFISMTFWGLSGVLMWWQLKRTRLLGALLLIASTLVAAYLAIGMHSIITG